MKKWMLCVLALATVGFTFDSAEAGGRRGRSCRGSSCGSSGCSSYQGGYAYGWTSVGGATAAAPMTQSTTTTVAAKDATTPVQQATYIQTADGRLIEVRMSETVVQTGGTVQSTSPVTSSSAPVYYYSTGYSSCSGGRCR